MAMEKGHGRENDINAMENAHGSLDPDINAMENRATDMSKRPNRLERTI